MNKRVEKEIDRLVSKHPWDSSRELFRDELEYLAKVVRGEQIKESMIVDGWKLELMYRDEDHTLTAKRTIPFFEGEDLRDLLKFSSDRLIDEALYELSRIKND